MQYADLKEGMRVRVFGIPCLDGAEHRVREDNETKELYLICKEGRHYLEGQLDEWGKMVGVEAVEG